MDRKDVIETLNNSKFVVEYHFDGCKGCPYLEDDWENENKEKGYFCSFEFVSVKGFSWFPYDDFLQYDNKVMECCHLKEKPNKIKTRKWIGKNNNILYIEDDKRDDKE